MCPSKRVMTIKFMFDQTRQIFENAEVSGQRKRSDEPGAEF